MASTSESTGHRARRSDRLLALLLLVPVAAVLGTAWLFNHAHAGSSLFLLSNLIGPATQSLLHGQGFAVCTEAMGTPSNPICFHAARMPLPSLVIALGVKLFGNRYLPVALFKAILLLLPLEAAIYLAWRRMQRTPRGKFFIALLLLAPFTIDAFLANTVNLQVEEAYAYSVLALAAAILFFALDHAPTRPATGSVGLAILFALSLDALYLSKSSLILAAAALLIGYLLMERRNSLRLLVLALVAIAPIGWATYQHHASDRYTIGTSLDGINLHKGNNPAFLDHYPPPPGNTLDRFDSTLNSGHTFTNEWAFNDYNQTAALTYLRTHPVRTVEGDLRKLNVLLFSLRKIGSTRDQGARLLFDLYGLLLFRLILWSAIISALAAAFLRPATDDPQLRTIGGIFLALTIACIAPYIAGFAYTRHASILIYPATLLCCRMIARNRRAQQTSQSPEALADANQTLFNHQRTA
jgi:hypothetical protein